MKKCVFALFGLIFMLSACKEDFDITADYKETPVVYGLLNHQENTHYIRIQKGYLIKGNALVAAGVADSVYYSDSLTVQLKTQPNGAIFYLTKVNGDLIGLPKDSGTFANSPNILYRFTGNLDPAKTYRLEVTNNTSGKLIYAETALVKDFQILVPSKGSKLNLQSVNSARARWYTAENAGIYDVTIRFPYREFRTSDHSLYRDTFINIPLLRSQLTEYVTGTTADVELTSDVILNYLAAHVHSDIEVEREFNIQVGMRFIFAAGGTELARFMNAKQAQSGIASSEALPVYTNISDGIGLLSSRYYKQVDSVLFSNSGLDTLACSGISKGLKFKNHNGIVCP